jgi:hypothetical protein
VWQPFYASENKFDSFAGFVVLPDEERPLARRFVSQHAATAIRQLQDLLPCRMKSGPWRDVS